MLDIGWPVLSSMAGFGLVNVFGAAIPIFASLSASFASDSCTGVNAPE